MGDNSNGRGTLPHSSLPEEDSPPEPPKLSRYRDEGWIGSGSSGRVYKAWDRQLTRYVALKFLRADVQRESQAQARVDHPNVCKVYEVGVEGGHPYIAMQLISGPSLTVAAREMTITEKLRLVISVAEALEAAHHHGLIHRDIKPSNILLEAGESGMIPYLSDFGLARELSAPAATVSGAIVGTPQYMSPEQARGDRLDVRSDVYSLGATLYELLSGRPPFDGGSVLEVLRRVGEEEPPPLRGLSRDLELVVQKCLDKRPERRYGSARQLADDLRRFLDGEPVQARRAGSLHRLGKRVWRHKALSLAVTVSLLAGGALAWGQLHARRLANERARLAERLGRDTRDLEAMLRYSYTLPLHDTRRDKARVRQRMKDIEAEAAGVGEGAAEYALGRGYLALHEDAEARAHLDAAWAHGQRGPSIHYALGSALGALYQHALDEADRASSPDLRAAGRRQAERLYRDPALSHLREAIDGSSEAPDYVAGLIALYEQRWEDVIHLAQSAAQKTPWLYEALALEGEAHIGRGSSSLERGDIEAALAAFGRAGDAYRRALEIARSDSTVYDADCQRAYLMVKAQLERGPVSDDQYRSALGSCGLALLAEPDDARAYLQQAALYGARAAQEIRAAADPESDIERIVENSQRAGALAPRTAQPLIWEAQAYKLRAEAQMFKDRDPRPALELAIARMTTAAGLAPDATLFEMTGRVQGMLAESQWEHGADPSVTNQLAAAALERGLAMEPDVPLAWSDLAMVHDTQAEWDRQHGKDPSAGYARALECLAHATQLAPGRYRVTNNLGLVHLHLAQFDQARGVDPRGHLDEAAAAFRRATELNPSQSVTWANLGSALMAKAQEESFEGDDPRATAKPAAEALQQAVRLAPDDSEPRARLGELHLALAENALERGDNPEPDLLAARRLLASPSRAEFAEILARVELSAARWAFHLRRNPSRELARADAAVARALALEPEDADAFVVEARARRTRAELLQAASAVDAGLAAVERALSLHPDFAEALAEKGALQLLQARGPKQRERAGEAAASLTAALQKNPLLGHRYSPLAASAAQLAR